MTNGDQNQTYNGTDASAGRNTLVGREGGQHHCSSILHQLKLSLIEIQLNQQGNSPTDAGYTVLQFVVMPAKGLCQDNYISTTTSAGTETNLSQSYLTALGKITRSALAKSNTTNLPLSERAQEGPNTLLNVCHVDF